MKTREYRDGDGVNLFIITQTNHINAYNITRKWASDTIRMWYAAREDAKSGKAEAVEWLEKGSLVFNVPGVDEGLTYAMLVVDASAIVGMYITETDMELAQEKLARAQSKIADAIDRESRKGDEWQQGDEE